MQYLIEQENKAIRLVEERGVAAFPYKTTINQIFQWCQTQCAGMRPTTVRKFAVPASLTSKIDFVKDLTINVSVEDGENLAYKHGGGNLNVRLDDTIVNGKYSKAIINIEGYSYYGVLYQNTILNSFYHELNHLYEAWKELISTKSMSLYAKGTKKSNINVDWFNDDDLNNILRLIFYRLYSETEMNAMIAGVFGDLQGINSTRKNFSNDIKTTHAYQVYNKIKTELPIIVQIFKDNLHLVKPMIKLLKANGFEFNPYYKNEQGYIKEFNRRTQYLLKHLIRGIGKTASLYYDSKEVPEDDINITIKNK